MTARIEDRPAPATGAQRARRARVVDAVVELVREGDLDALQMKDVARRSGVALGTIYRYFSSKDHLLAAALVEWARGLEPARTAPEAAASAAERAAALLRRGMRAYERNPSFARVLILATGSDDPNASACVAELTAVVDGGLGYALGAVPAADVAAIGRVIGAVWWLALVDWVNGRRSIGDVHRDLADACRLLLEGRDGAAGAGAGAARSRASRSSRPPR